MRKLSQTRLIGLFCCCGLILITLSSRPVDLRCVGSPLELREEAGVIQDGLRVQTLLLYIDRRSGHLDAVLLRLPSSHLEEPPRKTQDTLEVLCLSASLRTPQEELAGESLLWLPYE